MKNLEENNGVFVFVFIEKKRKMKERGMMVGHRSQGAKNSFREMMGSIDRILWILKIIESKKLSLHCLIYMYIYMFIYKRKVNVLYVCFYSFENVLKSIQIPNNFQTLFAFSTFLCHFCLSIHIDNPYSMHYQFNYIQKPKTTLNHPLSPTWLGLVWFNSVCIIDV